MSKISQYNAITSVQQDDLLVVVDVHDSTMSTSGTTKKMTISQIPVGSSTLAGDTDVTLSSPSNNQVLTYNTSSGKWINQSPVLPSVTSVFTRTGAVIAQTGDYTPAQVGAVNKSGDTMSGFLAPVVTALTFGATIAVNAALGNVFSLTLTASTGTISNPTNPIDGQIIRFRITQDATGSRTVAWGTAYDFGSAGAPTLTTTASKVDVVGFEYNLAISKWCYMGIGLGF